MKQVIGNRNGWVGRLQWHGEMHSRLGGDVLSFWFLRMPNSYEKAATFSRLIECMESVGSTAYAGYEISGEFDLMLRIWLPPSAEGSLESSLRQEFERSTIRRYVVTSTLRHWVWEGSELERSSFDPMDCIVEDLDFDTLITDVAKLNRLSDESQAQNEAVVGSKSEEALVKRFMAAHAIEAVTGSKGIRLVLRIRMNRDAQDEDLQKTTEGLVAQLDSFREGGPNGKALRLREISVYECSDTVIVLCRIDYEAWHQVRDHLLTPISRVPNVTQTTTLPALTETFAISRERLEVSDFVREQVPQPVLPEIIVTKFPDSRILNWTRKREQEPVLPDLPVPPKTDDIHDYFDREESAIFEIKGSAFAPLEPWLGRAGGASHHDGLIESKNNEHFRRTIGKTTVAMLNSQGGEILIGALESDRKFKNDLMEARKRDLPQISRLSLVGLVDPTYRERGWDAFERKFHSLIKSMIDGQTAGRVDVRPAWHNGMAFAVVKVKGRPPGPNGFYLKGGPGPPVFYIRRGGQSDSLEGNAITVYLNDDPLDWAEPV